MENKLKYTEPFSMSTLETVPAVFKNFAPDDLRGVLDTARVETLEAGLLLNPKKNQHNLGGYLVADGKLAAQRFGQTIEMYSPGDFINEAFVHSKVFIDCELVTLEPSRVLVFERESMLYFFRDKPEKLLKIFTINVVEAQQKHICALYKRISGFMMSHENELQ